LQFIIRTLHLGNYLFQLTSMTFDTLQRCSRSQNFCKLCCSKAALIVPVLSVRRTFSSWVLWGVNIVHRLVIPQQEEGCLGLFKSGERVG